ncbi:MAG: STAS domain-containing protein [Vibrio sp.]
MLTLNEALDIAHVHECKQQFLLWIAKEEPLMIDGSAVVRMDSAGLQLLTSLLMTAQHSGLEIHFDQLSDVLEGGLAQLGIKDLMQVKSE